MRYRIRILLLVVGWPLTAVAADDPLTLEAAIDQAMGDTPQVAASAAMLDAAQAVAPSAGRLPDPELIAGVDNLPIDTADRFSFSRDFMTMRKIGVMQRFPNAEKRRLQSERASRSIDVAEAQLRKTRFETAQGVADAWIASAVADESLVRLRELRPDAELQAVSARAALSSGRTSTAEALSAQSLLAGLEERILMLTQDAEVKRADLSRWIGSAAERPLAAIPTDRELEHSADALVSAVSSHPPLAPLVARIEAAKTDVELARADKRPDWSTELTYSKRGAEFSDMVSLEFRVSLPLFARNRQNPMIAEKLATVRAQEAMRDSEVRMHTAEVQAMLVQWRRGRERLKRYTDDLIPLARDRAHAAVASYGAGRGELRGAVEALTEEINTQISYVELEGAVARAWVFLHLLHDSETPK